MWWVPRRASALLNLHRETACKDGASADDLPATINDSFVTMGKGE